MRIPDSELMINSDGSIFHLHIRPDQLADKLIVVGDPGRVDMFKPLLNSIECQGQSREFAFVTGEYKGERITVLSHGIGPDNIDIVMTELDAIANIDFETKEVKSEHKTLTIVRLGTCGAVQPDIPVGSFILSHYSVGFDGVMNWYEHRERVTDAEMEKSFLEHMHWLPTLPTPYFVKASEKLIEHFSEGTVKGMTISAGGFYGPQGRVVRQGLAMPNMLNDIESWRYGEWRITNFEMESSVLAGMARQLGHEAITICCAIANRHLHDASTDYKTRVNELVKFVLDKMASL